MFGEARGVSLAERDGGNDVPLRLRVEVEDPSGARVAAVSTSEAAREASDEMEALQDPAEGGFRVILNAEVTEVWDDGVVVSYSLQMPCYHHRTDGAGELGHLTVKSYTSIR